MNAVAKTDQNALIVPQTKLEQAKAIDSVVSDAQIAIAEATASNQPTVRALTEAAAMNRLRELINDEFLEDVRALMNTKLGFRTDRDPGTTKDKSVKPYNNEVLRDFAIEALLRGFRLVGNEVNIIAGNLYATREGLERVVREFPGLSDLRIELGVPANGTGGALVPATASWKLNGVADEIRCEDASDVDTRIPVRVNNGMGCDAIHGKARRKLYARVLERISGAVVNAEEPMDTVGDIAA